MQRLLLRYTQALMTQIAQTAVCNRHHSIDQQLCRWLLLTIDRLPINELTMTQELIANMLGARRSSVTEEARKLQDAGLIRYSYGHIEVLGRRGLEARACACYGVVARGCDRLLPRRNSNVTDAACGAANRQVLPLDCAPKQAFSVQSRQLTDEAESTQIRIVSAS